MSSQKSIKLYIYESETSSLPFCYPSGEQVEICAFKYNAKRMGGTPTITCTLKSQDCLDSYWTNSIYCVFRDEKFYLRQTPSGTKSNTEYGYSYSLEFVSERDVLNNVYIFDAVNTDEGFDKPASNSTKISFFGDINRFADKINASLRYSGLQTKDSNGNIIGYEVVVDGGITSEEKYISIENTFFSNAIQEAYNTFEIPYYFKGKKIHIGYKDALIPRVFKYGVDDSLLSIKRENANNKIVNRATGIGSGDNIPYYYPNNSPKGDIGVVASERLSVKIVDYNRFASTVDIDEVLTYTVGNAIVVLRQWSDDGNRYNAISAYPVDCVSGQTTKKWFRSRISIKKTARYKVKGDLKFNGSESEDFIKYIDFISLQDEKFVEIPRVFNKEDGYFDLGIREAGDYWVVFGFQFTYRGTQRYYVTFNPVLEFESGWKNSKGESITLSDAGLKMAGGPEPEDGDTIKQILIKRVNTTSNLMPSIYRETDGKERFYNAINGKYVDESGNPIVFNNPYIDGRPSENIVSIEEIKPTIKDTKNSSGQQIDMFSEIAYDEGDSDEVYTDSEGNTSYKHPHFFAKLRKLPFNLFDCAIEGSEMTFSITKGDCGACSFKIKVDDEFPYRNTVQVYEEDTVDNNGVLHRKGTLVRDDDGRVLCGLDGFQSKVIPQAIQQDTINNEVWIALEKEEETYGILMPKAPKYNDNGEVVEAGYRIKPCSSDAANDGDTFVILNINLPKEYIIAAEKRLEDTIIANMKDNNDERFNFSITFSSIFFEEHPEILSLLDENSQINIEYAGEQITQYVSSFSYNMNSGSALPSISVDLSDSLSVSKNSIKTAIKQVQLNVQKALEHSSVAQQVAFVSKIENDVVSGNIDFRKGIKFGDGGQVEIDEYNNTKLIIDYLTVNKKAIFTALDVQDMHHVGGRVLITPASMICNKVEEFADFYRCFFQNYDDSGNQIFNNFVVDDQAICKTFNTWGTTYYWRLVVGVGNDYIDLSKTDCDEGSDIPRSGDKIVQLGNRRTDDNSRKSAIEISAYGDNTPSFVMYTDIDSYSLESKEIHGTIYRNNDGEYEAYFYNYGSMRLGAKEGEEGGYITYDHTSKQLNINAIVNFLPQSTGLEQMESYQKLVKIAQGNIETWFYDGVSPIQSGAPTISNYPVNTWEARDYENHIGDIYYSDTGKGYRFKKSGSSWEWEIISDAEMAHLMAEVQNLQYLKTALSDGTTTVAGGLILTSLIQLGYKDAQDVRHTMAGISGLGQNSKSPAAWYGGPMVDHELNPDATEFARSLFRFDGTGYLASGNITWDSNGYGQVGGKGDDYAIKWNNNGVFLGSGMKITESGQETLATLLEAVTELRSWFGKDDKGDIYTKSDENGRARGLYSYSFISSAGKSDTGGAGGGTVIGATVGGKEVTLSGGILEFDAYPTTTSLGLKALAFNDSLAVADIIGLQSALDGKQNVISDLATIRANASNGNTAYNDLSTVSTALQSLQSQIDSLANRNDFDEVNASALFADNLSARRVLTGEYIQIGNATISWDERNGCLKVDKGLYSIDFLSSGGKSDTEGAGSGTVIGATVGGVEVKLIDGVLKFDAYPTAASLGLKDLAFKDFLSVNDIPTLDISKISGLQSALDGKQAVISDLATIREWATLGKIAHSWGNHASAGYALASNLTAHTGNSTIHITAAERTAWNNKYDKPASGIPKSDLAQDVQTSLGFADSAYEGLSIVSAALQSLQSQIDSVANRKDFDEINASAVFADNLSARRVLTGEFIQIGNAVISWDAKHDCLKVDKGLYSTSFLSSAGFSDTGGTGGGTVVGATVGGKEVKLSGGILEFDAYPTTTSLGLKNLAFKDSLAVSEVVGLQSELDGKQNVISDLATIMVHADEGHTAYGYFSNGKLPYSSVSGTPTKLSQFTNDSGYITSSGSCDYATSAGSVSFSGITGKPTTISGYGITDALTTSNYNSYTPKLDGTGASGTWGISISGNAATATNATYATYDNSGEQIAGNFTKVGNALQSLQAQIDSLAGAKGDEMIATVVSTDIVTAQNAYIAVMHGSLDGNAATATNATYAAYDNSGEHIADNFSKVGAALKSLQSQIDSVASRDFAELSETLLSLKLWIEDMFTLTSSGIRTKYNFYTEGNLASGKA